MLKNLLNTLCALFIATGVGAQQISIYNPQDLYDEPGGLLDKDIVRSMFIEFEDSNYHNILGNAFYTNPDLRIPATVTIDEQTVDSVGTRYKGNSTFCLPYEEGNVKVPYNMDFNYWQPDADLLGFHKVKLANAWLDPTFAKEYIGAQIYQRYLPTPEVNLIALHTQGEYTGIYVNTESINKQFLNKHFDENDGVLFKCDGAGVFCGDPVPNAGEPNLQWLGSDTTDYYTSYDLKSNHGWSELVELIYTINFDPVNIENKLNVDRVLWAFAVNQTICNLDTYNGYFVHNYYMYLAENGLWQMIPWDMDNSFGGALLGFDYFNPNVLFHFNPYTGEDVNHNIPLANLLLNNPLYRKQYNAHLRTIINESLDNVAVLAEANEIIALAYDAIEADDNKLFNMNLLSQNLIENIFTGWGFAGISSTVEVRRDYLLSNQCPEIIANAPEIYNVELSEVMSDATGTYVKVSAAVNGATEVDLMATLSEYNSHFEPYQMNDLSDGTFETNLYFDLNNSVDWKFYIRAMNDEAMTLSPERAEYEFYYYTTPVGIDNIAQITDMELIPNPTSTKFSFRGLSSVDQIIVYDIGGRIIHSQNGLYEVNVQGWNDGVYIVEASIGEAVIKKRLVVCE